MIYLASPYTSPSRGVMEMRYHMAAKVCVDLLTSGAIVYSPIVHCHELAKNFDLPRDINFWRKYNFGMIKQASILLVLKLPGWDLSRGINDEIDFAVDNKIPVDYMEFS